ncbi:MAG: response regulator [Deltaproteobacteria bacterium]|nr:response regulator [Deltaproteobacteria bacterium]
MKKIPRILVIDDENDICVFLKNILSEEGYEVLTALSVEKGIETVSLNRPDIVLIDKNIPAMSGIDGLTRIRDIDRNAVVIVMTAYGSMESAKHAMELGAFDYITKPFDLDYVKAVIKNSLRARPGASVSGTASGCRMTARDGEGTASRQAARNQPLLEGVQPLKK